MSRLVLVIGIIAIIISFLGFAILMNQVFS